MTNSTDVAIVGAGPYGLSLAAHLREAGVPYRQFGVPMKLWRTAMPRGMYLKSQGFASNLSDPKQAMTLESFCSATGRAYGTVRRASVRSTRSLPTAAGSRQRLSCRLRSPW